MTSVVIVPQKPNPVVRVPIEGRVDAATMEAMIDFSPGDIVFEDAPLLTMLHSVAKEAAGEMSNLLAAIKVCSMKEMIDEKSWNELVALAPGAITPEQQEEFANCVKVKIAADNSENDVCEIVEWMLRLRRRGQVHLMRSDDTFDLHATTLHSMISKIEHSCQPNVVIIRGNLTPLAKNRTEEARAPLAVVAIRPICRGERLTVSFVNMKQPLNRRHAELQVYDIDNCSCPRCVVERQETLVTVRNNMDNENDILDNATTANVKKLVYREVLHADDINALKTAATSGGFSSAYRCYLDSLCQTYDRTCPAMVIARAWMQSAIPIDSSQQIAERMTLIVEDWMILKSSFPEYPHLRLEYSLEFLSLVNMAGMENVEEEMMIREAKEIVDQFRQLV